jgi:hypothetical protein
MTGSSKLNNPPTANPQDNGWLEVEFFNNLLCRQTYKTLTNRDTWIRNCVDGVWNDWTFLYTTGSVVGTVSQSAGVPTGAIIQRGGNANGQFTRFADGTQDCWHIFASGTTPSLPVGSLFTTNNLIWTYPVEFANSSVAFFPAVHSGAGGDFTWAGVGDVPVSATEATYRGWRPISVTLPVTFALFAKGRWFNI